MQWLAAYFNIDPTIVSVAFVAAAMHRDGELRPSAGDVIGLYVVLVFLVPYAKTSFERAAAAGRVLSVPDKVQHNVERVKAIFDGVRHNA